MRRAFVVSAVLVSLATDAQAQRPVPLDTLSLDPLVVTAERARSLLSTSVVAVSSVDGSVLQRFPRATVADALRQIPGFALVSFDGLDNDPQIMVRGFYGAGEAEYMVVMIDGKPVNQLQSGVVSWDALPLNAVRSIEVVRGGSSALYGDAAIGGVINIITARPLDGLRFEAIAGEHNSFRGDAQGQFSRLNLFAGADVTDGARDHSERSVIRGGLTLPVVDNETSTLSLGLRAHRRDYDEPGALLEERMNEDRLGSDPLHRFDHTLDYTYTLTFDAAHRLGSRARLTGAVLGEYRDALITRTLALAPGFGDTKERDLETARAFVNGQLEVDGLLATDRLTAGADFSGGTIDSRYYEILSGVREQYVGASGERGDLSASGSGNRKAVGLFADYSINPVSAVRISAGARYDYISDSFSPSEATENLEATHDAVSPKLGVNVQLARGLNVYASAGRSFKAPTLEQLYDQRSFPVPFPPFSVTTSNDSLQPSRGKHYEAGLYHSGSAHGIRATASLSAYQMDMEEELDFDVTQLRYENIGQSRHRGIEAGMQMYGRSGTAVHVNYTLQAPTLQTEGSDNEGNYLKHIPRHVINGGVSQDLLDALTIGAAVTHARGAYLDDANTETLDAYTRIDAQIAYRLSRFTIFADARNLFDAEYSTLAFFDPAGTGARYHYPAAGRTIQVGVRGSY
jgi:outer membrane receptor protein involved in Fe transport